MFHFNHNGGTLFINFQENGNMNKMILISIITGTPNQVVNGVGGSVSPAFPWWESIR